MIPPTTDAMEAQAYKRLDEILGDLATTVSSKLLRSTYEKITQQVFPLVAATSIMETLGTYQALAMELCGSVGTSVEGMVPEPEPQPMPPVIEGQLEIGEEA